eukprot:XP_001706915.1 Hypothetical protein GL50803_26741 [Giardia lamblia ATCC 50803]
MARASSPTAPAIPSPIGKQTEKSAPLPFVNAKTSIRTKMQTGRTVINT